MLKAIYAGTFDPMTLGHLEIIERASKLVDELVILVANNSLKKSTFTVDERISMISKITTNLKNVTIDHTDDLVVRYAEKKDIKIMIRGLRNIQDYEYEYSLSNYNSNINPDIETVLLFPTGSNHFVSSSGIKELVIHNADISKYVPEENIDFITKRLKKLD